MTQKQSLFITGTNGIYAHVTARKDRLTHDNVVIPEGTNYLIFYIKDINGTINSTIGKLRVLGKYLESECSRCELCGAWFIQEKHDSEDIIQGKRFCCNEHAEIALEREIIGSEENFY